MLETTGLRDTISIAGFKQHFPRYTMQVTAAPNFGRYRILAEIGRGAMGVVYKARDPKIDRVVAIKTIALSEHAAAQEREFRERFFLEAKAAGRLSHPSIVTIHDVGEDEESQNPFIVMEYVEGVSLDQQFTDTAGQYDAYSALALIHDLAAALDYAHSQGIVHRDIKPANILLTRDGRPKITDFGIAKLNMAYQTIAGQSLGTPAYMSPEQLNGDPVDGRSDLFSLGVILYTSLTGHRPFQGNSAMTVSFRVVHREPLPVSAYDSNFPPDVDYVIGRAIAKDAAQRYQTGKEMADDLDDLREGRTPRSKEKQPASANAPDRPTQAVPATPSTTQSFGPIKSSRLNSNQNHGRARLSAWEYSALILLGMGVAAIAVTITRPPTSAEINLPLARQSLRTASANAEVAANVPATIPKPPVSVGRSHVTPSTRVNNGASLRAKAESGSTPRLAPRPAAQHYPPDASGGAETVSATSVSPAPQKSATLHIRIEHRFPSAQVLVWIDDKLAYKESSDGTVKRRMGLFKAVQGYKSDSLALSSGEHKIRVRVQSSDSAYDRTASITGTIPATAERVLTVDCTNRKQIHLTME